MGHFENLKLLERKLSPEKRTCDYA
jgi:hypothetical protein